LAFDLAVVAMDCLLLLEFAITARS
jgi:hypothetical protein